MTDLDRGKDYEPDIYATHEEDYDDFDVDEEEEGGSRAAIILLIVIGVVLLLGVGYVSYRMGYENGQRYASVPRLHAAAGSGKVKPANPGGLEKPQDSALDDSITGEGGDKDDFAQLLPHEEKVEAPAKEDTGKDSGSKAQPGTDVPVIGVDPDSEAAEPADAPGRSSHSAPPAPKPAKQAPAPKPRVRVAEVPSPSGRIMVPKPGGAAPRSSSAGAHTSGSATPRVPPSNHSATIRPPSASVVPAPRSSAPAVPSGPAPSAGMTGNYVIQLASLPSTDAANAAYHNVTAKFPDLLRDAVRDIEEADLGERGTFYRLRVGYFQSKSEANRLCQTLKSRGQDCLVKTR